MQVGERLTQLRQAYAARRPESRRRMQEAKRWMPGGNTRSVLHFEPFPMVIAAGEGDRIRDVDGFDYIDCAGEFSAGLYGHGERSIRAAQEKALADGLVLVGPNLYEAGLARELCDRFASVERVRFCNSGTEANLFAVLAARAVTGRNRILVFEGAYHGGVMVFSGAEAPMNVPFEYVLAAYNCEEDAARLIRACGEELAAVLVEPVLGAAGNLPASHGFLERLRAETRDVGALLIFDEVKTSRLGAGGVQGLCGVAPDLTTFGKYLGAGLPFGAFGGRADIMDRFDPSRPGALKHAGTFNNNVMSMAGGLVGLREVFTAERADSFLERGEAFRHRLEEAFAAAGIPVRPSGLGSMISLHVGENAPARLAELHPATDAMRRLVHLKCLEEGLATTPRGDIFLSLPMTDDTLAKIEDKLLRAVRSEAAYFLSA
ncbi:aspartate aminotransferase family protein [Afifella pfennigii]|uniref:aspartate aminotransferase family protein n=1 Tax=Afifella pfennigii TaxID=209897 RepID=UPI00054F2876|nr:aminotransferase class III-fold pyridoxal phosphate-dependent enzyme [Afifella pfennigii]